MQSSAMGTCEIYVTVRVTLTHEQRQAPTYSGGDVALMGDGNAQGDDQTSETNYRALD